METQLAVLGNYSHQVEAETIRIRLAAAGIRAFVTGTDAATALGLGGAATWRTVRIEVPEADYERARRLLEEDQRRILEQGPWECSRCREPNEAAFEVCWSCAKPRDMNDALGSGHRRSANHAVGEEGSVISIEPPLSQRPDDPNPYRPILVDDTAAARAANRREVDSPMTEDTAESVTRAFRAAIVGMIVFPPLMTLYSLSLLVTLSPEAYRSRSFFKPIVAAWCINLAMIPVSIFLWSLWFEN